jgi:hypothetical protein
MSLLEAAKKLKEKNRANDKVIVQNVEWDLDPSFIGEPMVPRVLKRLSQYVDQRLTDYSAVYGANPATNMPRAILDYGDEPTLNLNNVQMGHNSERPTDVVDGDGLDENDFPTENTTEITREDAFGSLNLVDSTIQLTRQNNIIITDDSGEDLHLHKINVQEDSFTIENPNLSNRSPYASPPEPEGVIIDDPYLFDASENWLVRQHLRTPEQVEHGAQENIADESWGPELEAYIPENAASAEKDTLLSSEITIPPGSSLFHGSDPLDSIQEARDANEAEAHFANTGEVLFQPSPSPGISLGLDIHDGIEIVPEIFPAEDQGILHGNDYHHELTFNEVTQRGRAAGVQVSGINPANFRLDENLVSGAEGYDPTREGVDNHVNSNGALPGVRFRVRDSFIRNRHLTLKVPQYELMGPGSKGKAYVTSYTVEHQTHKIKARIITAPPDLTLDDESWFELCTNGAENTLKAVVKSTVKANLCIYKPSRVAFYGRNVDARAEKVALETLRDMITEQEFRHYLRYGFLTVRGSSGRVYQIPRDGQHTKIWERGKLIEEVCVRINGVKVPPTDNVIAFKVMIESNEEMFKSLGNVYKNKEAA